MKNYLKCSRINVFSKSKQNEARECIPKLSTIKCLAFLGKEKNSEKKMMSCFLENIGMAGLFPQERWKGEERFDVDRKELSIQNSKSRRIFFKMEGN